MQRAKNHCRLQFIPWPPAGLPSRSRSFAISNVQNSQCTRAEKRRLTKDVSRKMGVKWTLFFGFHFSSARCEDAALALGRWLERFGANGSSDRSF